MKDVEDPVFFDAPSSFLKEGVQLVVPPLSALLARATLHSGGHLLPLVGADLSDHSEQFVVLLLVPSLLSRLFLRLIAGSNLAQQTRK